MDPVTEQVENKVEETPTQAAPQPKVEASLPEYSESDVKENKFVAALSYLGILFLVPLLVKKDSPYAQFHAKQGLVLCIAFIIGQFVFWIPVIGWGLGIYLVVVDIMGLVKTLQGKAWAIPGVDGVVKKLNI